MAATPRRPGGRETLGSRPGREPAPQGRGRTPRGPCAGRRWTPSPWFGRKRNGRGITPKSPAGWGVILIVCVVAVEAASLPHTRLLVRDGLVLTALAALVVTVICTWET